MAYSSCSINQIENEGLRVADVAEAILQDAKLQVEDNILSANNFECVDLQRPTIVAILNLVLNYRSTSPLWTVGGRQ